MQRIYLDHQTVPLLTGEAQDAYRALSDTQSSSYPDLKVAILDLLGLTVRVPTDILDRVVLARSIALCSSWQLWDWWLSLDMDSLTPAMDLLVLEQLLHNLPGGTRSWIKWF